MAPKRLEHDFPWYRSVWIFVMFDLPVDSRDSRRQYARFRKLLLGHGFTMLQYSVYARFCRSEETSEPVRRVIVKALPPDGQVRLVSVTDRQFARMEVYFGEKRERTETPPPQLMLF